MLFAPGKPVLRARSQGRVSTHRRVQISGATSLGSQADGCHGVVISSVTRTEDRLVVRYHETMPAPGSICNQATVSPAHFIAVAKSPLPVEFEAE
jgi:hypothetical protein